MPDRPVILTGFMGSGKSSIGKLLANSLGCVFIDLDSVIVKEAGKTINKIFAENGEGAFRKLESECLQKVLKNGVSVVAGGGGVVVAESNRRLMRDRGYVINLSASLASVLKRLAGAIDRPLYTGQDAVNRVQKLMEERKQFYADADIRIDTDNKSVEDVVLEILKVLRELQS